MFIGRQIAKYRKEKRLTQEQLGDAVGVTNRTVSKWESGTTSPGVDLIPSIAFALGVSTDRLFGIESQNTGRSSNGPHMFTVSDNNTSKRAGSVDYFGLDNIINESGDAEFLINGEPRHASGNIFTVEKTYEIHLKNISSEEGDSTNISLKPDVESLAANITKLIDGYNSFVDKADAYSAVHPKSDRLVREMSAIASLHSDELMNLGIELKEDGRIALDEDRLKSAAASGELKDNADALKGFTSAMLRKTNQVGLNPMNYADRTIVAYKNPGHNYATPYVTSAYTGMMFSSYC